MMFKTQRRFTGVLSAASLSAATLLATANPANAQLEALRNNDDQFIQSLREQGMSDLLKHFVETDPPTDPINRLIADVNLSQFVADDLLARASEANINGDTAAANDLFNQSRQTFEQVLAAQRKLVNDHKDDERIPIWEIDFAQMLFLQYLPNYYQNVAWHYEFGQPTPDHAAAYEAAVIEALKATAQATRRLDLLANRVGQTEGLRDQLEELGIWFRLDDYRRLNGPYWLGHAAHGVSLLPDNHAYFKAGNVVDGQRPDVAAEKNRLRGLTIDAFGGALKDDPRTAITARLISGSTLAWSDNVDDNDDAVDLYLDDPDNGVIRQANGRVQGFLAKLAKAVARWKAGELDTAEELLGGMVNDDYVRSDASGFARLLSADLLFKILNTEAAKAPAAERDALVAEAYERAYIELINDPNLYQLKAVLFARWAQAVDVSADPMSLPATVRMGIGDSLTQEGGALAQQVVATAAAPAPAVPNEAERWRADLQANHDKAKGLLEKAAKFNGAVIGEDIEEAIAAKGLFNLGMNKYWLFELKKIYEEGARNEFQPLLEVAKHWVALAERSPKAPDTQNGLIFAVGLLQNMDVVFNGEEIRQVEVRSVYARAFDLIDQLYPTHETAQNNRVYAGFNLYERAGDFERAVSVYRKLPDDHADYFQARRQMIYTMSRLFRAKASELRVLEATAPPETVPAGLAPDEAEAMKQKRVQWARERDQIVESLAMLRDQTVEDAELVEIDAEDVLEGEQPPNVKFPAATAMGAARVVLSEMYAHDGETRKSLKKLEGFEALFEPKAGAYAPLAALQAQPEAALLTLQGLIQTAQQQRIVSLLEAGQLQAMATQAEQMMGEAPEVAAGVVRGVLDQLEDMIAVQERIERDAPFQIQRDRAAERIKFLAGAAVDLSKLLAQWAQGQMDAGVEGFDDQRMISFQRPLAKALMLAGQAEEALKIMAPIAEELPNSFAIATDTGKAYIAVYAQTKEPKHYNGAMGQFNKIVLFYNQRAEKPEAFWESWYQIFRLLDIAGEPASDVIPARARMLKGIDENFGGAAFKDRFMDIIQRNGGVEILQPPS